MEKIFKTPLSKSKTATPQAPKKPVISSLFKPSKKHSPTKCDGSNNIRLLSMRKNIDILLDHRDAVKRSLENASTSHLVNLIDNLIVRAPFMNSVTPPDLQGPMHIDLMNGIKEAKEHLNLTPEEKESRRIKYGLNEPTEFICSLSKHDYTRMSAVDASLAVHYILNTN